MDILKQIDFAMTTDTGRLSFTFVLFTLIFGCILSWVILFYQRKVVGALVRALIAAGAADEASAKTLAEIGQEANVSALYQLRRERGLSRVVTVVGAEPFVSGKRKIPDSARFYVAGDAVPRAERQYSDKGTSVPILLLGILGILAVGILLFLVFGSTL